MTDFPGRFAALVRAQHSSRARAALVALAFVALSGCGKKGPPLAPFSSSPAAPSEVTVRRKGDQVEIHFKVPVANSDARRPAKIDHVQVYGLTMPGEKIQAKEGEEGKEGEGAKESEGAKGGRRPRGAAGPGGAGGAGSSAHDLPFRKYGTVVGSVFVRKPPPKPKEPKDDEPPPPPPPPRTDPGLDQGDAAVVIDTLTPASLAPVEIPEKDLEGPSHPHEGDHDHATPDKAKTGRNAYRADVTPPELGPPLPRPALRYYSLAGTNGKKKGVFAQPIAVPIEDLPPAPAAPVVTVAEGHIQVALTLPDGLRKPVIPPTPSPLAPAASPSAAPAQPAPVATSRSTAAAAPGAAPEDQEEAPPCTPTAAQAPAWPAATPAAAPAPDSRDQTAPAPPDSEDTTAPLPAPPDAQVNPASPDAQGKPPSADAQGKPLPPPCKPAVNTLLPAKLIFTYPSPTYGFMVYEMAPPDFTPPKQEQGAVPPYPALLTPAPVQVATWNDPRFVVGADRCYSVRLLMAVGQIMSESAASPTVCVKTVDTFPPAAPKNLQAVASEGTISLIWDSNVEADLAGYIVLRGAAGSDKLTALTPTPIKESTFRDTKVKAGVRYVYVVVAVDTATPQNVSAQSNRVEETAR